MRHANHASEVFALIPIVAPLLMAGVPAYFLRFRKRPNA